MQIILSNNLHLSGIPASFKDMVKAKLTMANPEFLEKQKAGRWTGETPRQLFFYKDISDGLIVPRGYVRQLIKLCRDHDVLYEIVDNRRTLPKASFASGIILRSYQASAVNEALRHDFGVLEAPTGSGKTVMALAIVAARKQPVLIVVHAKELLDQWRDRIESFLNIPKEEIGIIGAGQCRIGDRVTVGIVNSVYKQINQINGKIGFLVVDECHRTPSRTFTEAVSAFDCRYMLGLSATPFRRDGLTRVIYLYLGDRVHEIDKVQLQEAGAILKAEVNKRETLFTTRLDASEEYARVLSELTQDPLRNALIIDDVIDTTRKQGGISLVLSDRKSHCQELSGMLNRRGIDNAVLTGDMSAKDRQNVVEDLNQGEIRVLLATGQLIGEGFDCKDLSNLFITTPIKFRGRLIQYLGRVLRPAPGKDRAVVFDYIDSKVPVLRYSAKAREGVYHG